NIITAQFVAQAGMGATRLAIPGAASTAFRTEGCGDTTTTVIEPQEIGPGKKSGEGRPDLAFRTGAVMEVAEIKVGTWTCLPFAEAQLANYIEKGMAAENADWRQLMGITSLVPMPTMRFTPAPFSLDDAIVEAGWCNPGVVVYKAVGKPKKKEQKQEQEQKQE